MLTAIVISFAMTALLLALALRARFANGDDGIDHVDGRRAGGDDAGAVQADDHAGT